MGNLLSSGFFFKLSCSGYLAKDVLPARAARSGTARASEMPQEAFRYALVCLSLPLSPLTGLAQRNPHPLVAKKFFAPEFFLGGG